MNESTSASRDQRLHEVLAAYLQAADAGQAPDAQEFLAHHPDLADELAVFLSNQGQLEALAVAPDPNATQAPAGAAGQLPRVRYLGDYELLQELARGGMGVVYRARQVSLNRPIALKMILAGNLASEAEVRRFRAEAEAAANLEHPNIVPIYEVGEHEGQHYFSMKLIEGGSLSALIPEMVQDSQAAARLLVTVARAVHHAHQRGIFHRDLKPANILLDFPGGSGLVAGGDLASAIPMVTDFGLAKRTTAGAGVTHSGAIVGTPSYMAPEQAAARKDLTTAVDVYSLGAILYELLTGKPPFQAGTPLDTLMQVLDREPERPRQLNPKIDRDLETICLKCLEKDPERRYGSALELADDLERWLRGEPIRALPAGRVEHALKWVRRNRGLSAGLAAAVLALLLGTAVATWQAVEARTAAKDAKEQGEAARVAARTANVQEGVARRAAQDADEQRERAESLVYASKLTLAQREFQDGNLRLALELLEQCPPKLRGWEHRYLWTRFNGKFNVNHPFRGHGNPISCVCYSRDGTRLATASWDGTVKVWDAATEQEILTFRGHKGPNFWVQSVCFSPDGKCLASAGGSIADHSPGEVKIWNADTGAVIFDLKGHAIQATSVCFSPDGKLLASASLDRTLKVWDAETGREVITLTGYKNGVQSVCFSPDGKRLASAYSDTGRRDGHLERAAAVKLWDVDKWQEVQTFKVVAIGSSSHCKLAFSPDGTRLAVTDPRGIAVLAANTGKEIVAIKSYSLCVCFSPDGKRLASGDGTGAVRVWDADKGGQILDLKAHLYQVNSVCFSPDGTRLVSASANEVKVWDAERGQDVLTLGRHLFGVSSISFSPDGKRLAAATAAQNWPYPFNRGDTKLWDAERGREIPIKGHTHWKSEQTESTVCFSPDGKRIASAGGGPDGGGHFGGDGMWRVWDAATGKAILAIRGHGQACVTSVCYRPDGKRLASASADGTVKVWDAESGQEIHTLQGHSNFVVSVCFSPDGKRLASASGDKTVRIWDAETGKKFRTLTGHSECVNSVCFSPDGTRLASASTDKTVRIWDAQTGKALLTLRGHTASVRSVCYHPDGTRLASASDDATARVWDAEKGLEVLAFRSFGRGVMSVSFSADGNRLAGGGGDRVQIWEAAQAKPK